MFLIEFIKFVIYSILIVLISKYILVVTIRKLAECLKIKPNIIGDITGVSTSVPELLTITESSIRGFSSASVYNILSSNIINLIQYLMAIILNKNLRNLKNNAIIMDIFLVIITIVIPIFVLSNKVVLNIYSVPMLILLFMFFIFLNSRAHFLYLRTYEKIEKSENKNININKRFRIIFKYVIVLIITGVLLFWVGNLLGNSLENLCNYFGISELVIGVLLGFITSIPELITFFESQKFNKKVKNSEMHGVIEATNNLFTSNVLNLFIIQVIGILFTYI